MTAYPAPPRTWDPESRQTWTRLIEQLRRRDLEELAIRKESYAPASVSLLRTLSVTSSVEEVKRVLSTLLLDLRERGIIG